MTASTSIGLDQKCYDQARAESVTKHRTIAGQVDTGPGSVVLQSTIPICR